MANTTTTGTTRGALGGLATYGIFGAGLFLVALLGMILNFSLPWASFEGETLDRGDLRRGPTDYVDSLTGWPIISFVFLMILGVALVALEFAPIVNTAVKDATRAGIAGLAAPFAYLVTLTGFRWLGIYFIDLWNPGPVAHLHVVPYLNLVLGLGFLVASVAFARRALAGHLAAPNRSAFGGWGVRVPALTLAVAAAALLVFPLLPYASTSGAGRETTYTGEATFAFYEELLPSSQDSAKAGSDLGWVQAMVWITLYTSFAALAIGLVERSGRLPQVLGLLLQASGMTVIPLLVAAIFTILAYVHIPGIEETSLAFNYFPILAIVGLATLFVLYVQHILMPFVSSLQRAGRAAAGRTTP